MPHQRLETREEKGEIVNSRNQTLPDLLAQMGHYNATTRKGREMNNCCDSGPRCSDAAEAFVGLGDLLSRFPRLLRSELAAIVGKVLHGREVA